MLFARAHHRVAARRRLQSIGGKKLFCFDCNSAFIYSYVRFRFAKQFVDIAAARVDRHCGIVCRVPSDISCVCFTIAGRIEHFAFSLFDKRLVIALVPIPPPLSVINIRPQVRIANRISLNDNWCSTIVPVQKATSLEIGMSSLKMRLIAVCETK